MVVAQNDFPADKKATQATINLYRNLKKHLDKGVLFGHQDDLAYGIHWFGDKGRSNLNDLVGEYPAVYGWELGHLELDVAYNLDSVPFTRMREYIIEGYQKGGVITISWHLRNPVNGKTAWDDAKGVVKEILPGGSKHALYLSWVDKVASFLNSLKSPTGELIPVIFRPFHELTGNWFWWGQDRCTAQEYKQLMRMTIAYLRDTKQLHHLLYAYNTSGFRTKEGFMERYPGNDLIDILSFDDYQYGDASKDDSFVKNIDLQLGLLESIALENNKIPAWAETGYEKIPYSKWWTECLLKAIGQHRLSYVLVWRDGGLVTGKAPREFAPSDTHFLPVPAHTSEPDFLKMYFSGKFLFQRGAAALKLYEK